MKNEMTSILKQRLSKLKENGFFSADKKTNRLNPDSVITYNSDGYTLSGDCIS